MLEESIKSIKAYLYDRTVSPLLGAFIVSWSVWNYRFILLIFSDLPIKEKFEYIDSNLFKSGFKLDWICSDWYKNLFETFLSGLIIPLLIAVFFIYAYPYPAKKIFEFSRKRQQDLNKIKKTIDEETLLTRDESREIFNQIYQLEEDINKKDSEIKHLKDENKRLSLSVNENESVDVELEELDVKLLRVLSESKNMGFDVMSESDISSSILIVGNSRSVVEMRLEQLIVQGFIKKRVDSKLRPIGYSIEQKGLIYLKKYGYITSV